MHDDHVALLAACRADPGDLLPRLILADWLDDHGYDGSAWRAEETPPPDWLPEVEGCGHGYSDGSGGDGGGSGAGYGPIAGKGYGSSGTGGCRGTNSGHGGGRAAGQNSHGYDDDGDGDDGDGYGGFIAVGCGNLHPPSSARSAMPAIGSSVLVMSEGNHAPFAWCGRVVAMTGPKDWTLADASLIPYCGHGNTWAGLARGDEEMRATARIRVESDPIEVYGIQCCRRWVGELPTHDQN